MKKNGHLFTTVETLGFSDKRTSHLTRNFFQNFFISPQKLLQESQFLLKAKLTYRISSEKNEERENT